MGLQQSATNQQQINHPQTNSCIQIFCDFDGTITERDMIITLMEKFAPAGWEQLRDGVLNRQIPVQEGVGQMFAMIDTRLRQNMIEYAQEIAKIRPGFSEFIEFVKKQKIEFYVTSGGMDFFVYPILQRWVDPSQIFCNRADWTGDMVRVEWPYACDEQCTGGCGCCKPSLMRKFEHGCKQIVIGDSVTDAKASRLADFVFARSKLIDICQQDGIPYQSYETFFDIMEGLKTITESR
ncbi:2-hydroxy-3-keto-5-methylthiopentenyl-1-phosphate phosphatase [Fodinisporobacter ferrooxydans]|uniref:2-hydroxy-3-keto-5-methylthiopentenyl-1-phosphate phosphatase n=1 Tax=Fodinisporobacter ferrooxydans TaxID=2901836 RepID=A0ABY4CKD5_9BACL|nr:2-hydroxy-3-keto-5-methylthiopentenyl-1-phosphate phosphatase [Alicyclobacillaceae bacterium MYW30-H2]